MVFTFKVSQKLTMTVLWVLFTVFLQDPSSNRIIPKHVINLITSAMTTAVDAMNNSFCVLELRIARLRAAFWTVKVTNETYFSVLWDPVKTIFEVIQQQRYAAKTIIRSSILFCMRSSLQCMSVSYSRALS